MDETTGGQGLADLRVPVQDEASNSRRGGKPRGSVTWTEHVEAWNEYHRHHWGQDAVTIVVRGGFGFWELTDLLGHEPVTWSAGEVRRPREATLRAALAQQSAPAPARNDERTNR